MSLAWGCSVREMLGRIGADELREWEAFYRLNPWGESRADLRSALICRELHRTGFAGERSPKLTRFMPSFDRPKPTLEQRAQQFAAWTAAANSS